MMQIVHVVLTGIVGLVPGQGDSLLVVVPVVSGAEHQHVAHLLVENDSIVSSNGVFTRSEKGLTAIYLDGYDLVFKNLENRTPSLAVTPSLKSFGLDLERGCPEKYEGCGVVGSRFVGKNLVDGVAARLRLTAGELSASWVDPYYAWHFGDQPLQRIAQEFCNRFEISSPNLEIGFLRNGGVVGRLVLRAPKKGSDIEVRLANVLADEIFPDVVKPLSDDQHIKLHYMMSARPVPESLIPELLYEPVDALPTPPQDTHHHRLTPAGSRPYPGFAPPSVVVPVRITGSNCPPGLWRTTNVPTSGPARDDSHHR
jgi:hypothetical protein